MDQSGIHGITSMEDIEQGVIEFLKTINGLSRTPQSLEELSDGVILMELLSKINSTIFDMSKIEKEIDNNWAIKHKNIKKLTENIETYYHDILKLGDFDKDTYLDASEISQSKNKNEIVKLVELVLGIIVQSEQKSDFIHSITQLEKKYQAVLMHLMEKWIVQERFANNDGDDTPSRDSMCSSVFNSASVQYNTQSYYYQQNQQLLKKVDELESENIAVTDKIDQLKQDLLDKDNKLQDFEKDLNKKDEEIKKLKLSRDSLMLSLGMNVNEDIESVVKTKEIKIDQLNQTITQVQQQAQLEKDKLNDEISLLNKKIKQLQKVNEQLDFYKQKYEEYTSLSEKFNDADKKSKQFDKALQDKDSQIEMLMEKLQEYKQSYNDEKKKSMEKAIEISQKDIQIEQFSRELDQMKIKYHQQEEKFQELSQVLERYQQDENYGRDKNQGSAKKGELKGLNEDLSSIINDLERENTLLKCEQNTLDPHLLNLEDTASLKEQIQLLQTKLTESMKVQHEFEAKLKVYERCDVEKLKEDNEKLRADYQSLLAKSLKRKERREEEAEESFRTLQDELTRREQEIQKYQERYQEYNTRYLNQSSEKARAIDEYERKMNELQKQIANKNQQITDLQNQVDEKDKKNDQQKQVMTNLFQNKQEELDIIYGALCELRLKYQQIQSSDKATVC